jgi:hypothetical protein
VQANGSSSGEGPRTHIQGTRFRIWRLDNVLKYCSFCKFWCRIGPHSPACIPTIPATTKHILGPWFSAQLLYMGGRCTGYWYRSELRRGNRRYIQFRAWHFIKDSTATHYISETETRSTGNKWRCHSLGPCGWTSGISHNRNGVCGPHPFLPGKLVGNGPGRIMGSQPAATVRMCSDIVGNARKPFR